MWPITITRYAEVLFSNFQLANRALQYGNNKVSVFIRPVRDRSLAWEPLRFFLGQDNLLSQYLVSHGCINGYQ